jgi:hypothetical protein
MRAPLLSLALLAATPVAAAAPVAAPSLPAPVAAPTPRAEALAARIALAQLPPGAYGQLFEGMTASINRQTVDAMLQTPVRDLARLGGLSDAQVAALGEGTLRQVVELVDPAFEARTAAVTEVTMKVMGELFGELEPELRRVFAGIYARSFSEADLEAVAAFYGTPAGKRFAAKALQLTNDPAMQKATADMVPRMLKALAAAGPRIEQATKHLPPARTVEQLSPDERTKLLALIAPAAPAGKTAS